MQAVPQAEKSGREQNQEGRLNLNHYSSPYNIDHKAVADLLKGPVYVQEKVDGSQIGFGKDAEGNIHVRSKGALLNTTAPEKLFAKAVQTVQAIAPLLTPGWIYRGEYLAKPKHNTLAYDRVPKQHIVVFDISIGDQYYLSYDEVKKECARIGLEVVPLLATWLIGTKYDMRQLLETESFLGGQKIEGFVLKPMNYDVYGPDKKVLMAKFVSEAFREAHGMTWKASNPTQNDVLTLIGNALRTPARWQKALMHLEERGMIANAPQDISLLMREVPEDIERECGEEIKEKLYQWAMPHIRRKVVYGLPEWYKEELVKRQGL